MFWSRCDARSNFLVTKPRRALGRAKPFSLKLSLSLSLSCQPKIG